jgi:hypothetical protein
MKTIKRILEFCFIVLMTSCNNISVNYNHKIVVNSIFNNQELKSIQTPEKALLLGYLAIYGNECTENSDKIKCQILEALEIKNECDENYQLFLKKWFKNDVIKKIKLNNCPNLPYKSAIQNKIKKIEISRNKDTIQIIFRVIGMNTSQEKNWDIEQIERFLIKDNAFYKLN